MTPTPLQDALRETNLAVSTYAITLAGLADVDELQVAWESVQRALRNVVYAAEEQGKVAGWWLAHDDTCERGRSGHCYKHAPYIAQTAAERDLGSAAALGEGE